MTDKTVKTSEGSIRIRQVGSAIRRNGKQALHLKALGLRGIGSEKELILNNSILGLINKVRHMVKII
ncbi:MAG: 50S ribosomal protein L30 [Holosporales bacterium]|jgi:large subunit ribosomal protein L30|nr:50S ribosomal protein L30 [Holosporales bacterium]